MNAGLLALEPLGQPGQGLALVVEEKPKQCYVTSKMVVEKDRK